MSYSITSLTDDYYEGTNCLINKLNIKNKEQLAKIEASITMAKSAELERNPISDSFDFDDSKKRSGKGSGKDGRRDSKGFSKNGKRFQDDVNSNSRRGRNSKSEKSSKKGFSGNREGGRKPVHVSKRVSSSGNASLYKKG